MGRILSKFRSVKHRGPVFSFLVLQDFSLICFKSQVNPLKLHLTGVSTSRTSKGSSYFPRAVLHKNILNTRVCAAPKDDDPAEHGQQVM